MLPTGTDVQIRYLPLNLGGVLQTEEGYFYLHGNPKKKTHLLNSEERELYPFLPIELPVLKWQVKRRRIILTARPPKGPIGRPLKPWSEMSAPHRRHLYDIGDPRVPNGWTPSDQPKPLDRQHLEGMKVLMDSLRRPPTGVTQEAP
jgi:hypothetical protein